MNFENMETSTERFIRLGWFYTNSSEVLAEVVMEAGNLGIKVTGIEPGDNRYAIAVVK
jgi:hypothetical protein